MRPLGKSYDPLDEHTSLFIHTALIHTIYKSRHGDDDVC